MTLFEKYDNVISDDLIEKLKDLSERNLGDTRGSIDSIFHVLLAGLIRRANSDMSTNMLVNQIKKIYDENVKDFDPEMDFNSGTKLRDFVMVGEKNLSQIFPSMKSQLLGLVTTESKTGKKETVKSIGFVNSLFIKFLGDKLASGTGIDELMNYLKEHRDPLFKRAPKSLVEKMIPALGMHELRDMKLEFSKQKEFRKEEIKEEAIFLSEGSETSEANALETDYEYEEEESNKKPLLIAAAVVLIGLLGYFLYESKDELFTEDEPQISSVIEVTDEVITVDSLELEIDPAWVSVRELLNVANLPLENEISVESLSFVADSIVLSSSSNSFIDSLQYQFETNPRFQIQIKGGHSGGNSQVALRRAFYLKRELQSRGVDAIKIDAIADRDNFDYLKIKIISK